MIRLSDNREFRIKWAGPNTPYVDICSVGADSGVRIFLSKVDVKNVRNELSDFMEFYNDGFTVKNIVNNDDPEDWDDNE